MIGDLLLLMVGVAVGAAVIVFAWLAWMCRVMTDAEADE